jgi:hypothetical protein
MYEQDPTKLVVARGAITIDAAVQVWTVAEKDRLAEQAIALVDHAGVPLPPGTLEDLVSIRIPAPQLSAVDTEFHPWNSQEVRSASAGGRTVNLGEIRLGDNIQGHRVLQDYPALSPNQVRLLQLRALVHEVFHALDFGEVLPTTQGDRDRAIAEQTREIGFAGNRAGYARHEIEIDYRTAVVFERNGLLFPELLQSLNDYRAYWQGQGSMSEPAFAGVLAVLNRTRYP